MRKTLLAATLLVAVLALEVAFVYHYIVPREHYIFDFVQPWISARALLFDHSNPYGPEVTREVQMALVGHPIAPGQCQHTLLYPAFLAFVIPHFLLPYRLGLSVWIVTLQMLLVVSIWLIVRCTGKDKPIGAAHLLLLTLVAATSRYSLLNLGYAQYSILVLFWLTMTWWLWDRGQFLLAGVALSVATFKPQLVLLPILIWLLLALVQRRWRFIAGFGAAMALLLVLPCFFVGNWLPLYMDTLADAVRLCQTPVYTGSSALSRLAVFAVLVGGVVALTLLLPRRWQGKQLGLLLSLGIVATLLGTPYGHSYDMVIALLPLIYVLVALRRLRGKGARLLELASWSALALLPWLLSALVPGQELELLERWLFPSVVLSLLAGLILIQAKQSSTTKPSTQD